MKLTKTIKISAICACQILIFSSCKEEPKMVEGDTEKVVGSTGVEDGIKGFYLLNEGNMGSNKCTLDYFDYATATYHRNIYAERNPNVVFELGDTGNDIAIYGGKLFVVVNGSHKVEVLNAKTAKRIGQVDVASPRYLAFDGDYCYVSSFVGGEGENGSVVKFNINTLAIEAKASAGLQPEGVAVADGYLYVANSGQLSPQYDNTVTVINANDMSFVKSVPVAINMHHICLDIYGHMWINSRGNYMDIPADLYRLDKGDDGIYGNPVATGVSLSNMWIAQDYIYSYATAYDANWNATYTFEKLGPIFNGAYNSAGSFISQAGKDMLVNPYCVAVHPGNGDVLITDAKNYVSSGAVICFDKDGNFKWQATTGDLPGHIVFVK